MIYVLHGDDDFTMGERVASMKGEVGLPDLGDVNVTELDGRSVALAELVGISSTVPFLAEKRLVIVTGLLSRFESGRRGRQRAQPRTGLGEWAGLADRLEALPPTTDLVFVDGPIASSNPLLRALSKIGKAERFARPNQRQVGRWITDRARQSGISIEPRAAAALAEYIGNDLRVIVSELEKLSLYRSGETVRHEDVAELVSYARDANIFAAVDAILEGRSGAAIRMVQRLLQGGASPAYLLIMLARQVRLLILAKELKAEGVPGNELGPRLGLSGYPLRKTLDQENAFTSSRLIETHRRLLEADLRLKSTGADGGLIMDILVAQLSSA